MSFSNAASASGAVPPSTANIEARARELRELDIDTLRALLLSAECSISESDARSALTSVARQVLATASPAVTSPVHTATSDRVPDCAPTKIPRTSAAAAHDASADATLPRPVATATTAAAAAAPNVVAAVAAAPVEAAPETRAAARRVGASAVTRAKLDWSQVRRRRIALKLSYLGADYAGFSHQAQAKTVEGALFAALEETCLIPVGGITSANYTRCGRTDRGVSALAQVVALDVRTNHPFVRERLRAAGVPDKAVAALAARANAAALALAKRPRTTDKSSNSNATAAAAASAADSAIGNDGPVLRELGEGSPSDVGYLPRTKGLVPMLTVTNYPADADADADADAAAAGGAAPGAGPMSETDALVLAYTQSKEAGASDAEAKRAELRALFESYAANQVYRIANSHHKAKPVTAPKCSTANGDDGDGDGDGSEDDYRDDEDDEDDDTLARPGAEDPTIADPDAGLPDAAFDAWADAFEIDYVSLLNQRLPADIRVHAWAPVSQSFSARFSCEGRTYKYFFYADGMDLAAMNRAAGYLTGRHDFRNLCHMDLAAVTHFVRRICGAVVRPCAVQDTFSLAAGAAVTAEDIAACADASRGCNNNSNDAGAAAGGNKAGSDARSDAGLPSCSLELASGDATVPLPPALDAAAVDAAAAAVLGGDKPAKAAKPAAAPREAGSAGAAAASALQQWRPVFSAAGDSDCVRGAVPLATAAAAARAAPLVTTTGVPLQPCPDAPYSLRPKPSVNASAGADSGNGNGNGNGESDGSAASSVVPVVLPADTLCEFVVTGEAFLYHQVRCMMAVLFLVGQGLEPPEIVKDLFDIKKVQKATQCVLSWATRRILQCVFSCILYPLLSTYFMFLMHVIILSFLCLFLNSSPRSLCTSWRPTRRWCCGTACTRRCAGSRRPAPRRARRPRCTAPRARLRCGPSSPTFSRGPCCPPCAASRCPRCPAPSPQSAAGAVPAPRAARAPKPVPTAPWTPRRTRVR